MERMIVFGLVLIFIFCIVLSVYSSHAEQVAWDKFSQEHNCTIVGHKNSQSVPTTGFSSKGSVVFGVGTIPEQTDYKCDDGVEYWR